MHKKNFTASTVGYLFVTIFSFLYAPHPATGSQTIHAKETVEADMNLAREITSEASTIPPIDARAPLVVHTASFGLG